RVRAGVEAAYDFKAKWYVSREVMLHADAGISAQAQGSADPEQAMHDTSDAVTNAIGRIDRALQTFKSLVTQAAQNMPQAVKNDVNQILSQFRSDLMKAT